ncbi:hypothetical protein, partial [Acinetobacter sp. C15]|uniref:hypothetical protein n=1 Tax=Acinetobacter sp. C15 TaxID=1661746 RepID=UPI001BB2DA4B
RHRGFKIPRPQRRAGSSPAPGTILNLLKWCNKESSNVLVFLCLKFMFLYFLYSSQDFLI